MCVFVCVHILVTHVPVIQGWHAVAEIDKHEWQPGYNACEQEAINMALQDNQGAGNLILLPLRRSCPSPPLLWITDY